MRAEMRLSDAVRLWLPLFALIGGVLAADQLSKAWIVGRLALGETRQPIPALAPYFQITYSANTGAAFGLLPGVGDIIMLIAVAVVLGMLYFYPRIPAQPPWTRLAIGLICGGALGNVLDRLQYGYVVDFIHYQIPGVVSNVSNLADHAIVLGVIVVIIEN
ncbi:MAG: signal peptidase II, partial [Armatimonadetes bacterium]|nr:signal peptidase II [Anaerolineae bacterium]